MWEVLNTFLHVIRAFVEGNFIFEYLILETVFDTGMLTSPSPHSDTSISEFLGP